MNETKSNTHVFDKHDVSGTEALFSLPYDWALKTGLRCEVEEKAAGDKPYHWVEAIHRAKPLAGKRAWSSSRCTEGTCFR